MRGSFENIWSSSIGPVEFKFGGLRAIDSQTHFIGLMASNKSRCVESEQCLIAVYNSGNASNAEPGHQAYTRLIGDVEGPVMGQLSALLERLSLTVDAERLSNSKYHIPSKANGIIWFNFPWAGKVHTAELLRNFVTSAAGKQSKGDLFLLGLTLDDFWINDYKLQALLAIADKAGYTERYKEDIHADGSFLKECVELGYHHCSNNDNERHHRLVDCGSELHIFVKRKYLITVRMA